MKIELRCNECGKIYSKSLYGATRSRFCSKSCQSKNNAKRINLGAMGSRGHNKITFSDEQEQEILAYYNEGLSAEKIAPKFECGIRIIRGVLKKHNVTSQSRQFPAEVIARAIELYDQGLSVQSVADELQVGKTSLYKILKEQGVTENNRRNPHNKVNK